MSISYQFGDVDAHGALIRSQAASLEAEHQSIVRDVLAAGDFWGGSGSVACQEFITQLGRNFQVIYEQANSHGQKVQTAGNNMNVHRLRRRRQLGLTLHRRTSTRSTIFVAPAAPQPAGLSAFVGGPPRRLSPRSQSQPPLPAVAVGGPGARVRVAPAAIPANLDRNPSSKELPWKGLPER